MSLSGIIERARAARGWTREAWILALGLLAGAVLLPVVIYACGIAFLGSYPGAGLGRTFATILLGLRTGSWAAWIVFLGPYLWLQLLRALRVCWRLGTTLP